AGRPAPPLRPLAAGLRVTRRSASAHLTPPWRRGRRRGTNGLGHLVDSFPTGGEPRMSAFLTFVTHDWYFFWPMFFMSVTGITLVIWRLLLNINAATNLNEFLPAFQQKLDRDGVEAALRFCRARSDIIPKRLYVPGLEVSKQGLAAVRRAMANAIELEILPDLNFLLPSILAIAKIATMVGLLGTVLSMIGTFNAIQNASGGVQG